MNYLAENALPIWMTTAVLLTLTGVVYAQTRARAALLAMLIVGLFAAALLAYEHWTETPREAVERTLYELAAAVEANDLPAVLGFISQSAAEVRSDAEALMPRVEIEKARIVGTPKIAVDLSVNPPTATVGCQGLIQVTIKRSGMKAPYADRVQIQFVRSGGRWFVESYTPDGNWRQAVGR